MAQSGRGPGDPSPFTMGVLDLEDGRRSISEVSVGYDLRTFGLPPSIS
jgi:hypothetical protein